MPTTMTYTFENVTADHTIEAVFRPEGTVTYNVTASAGANGTVSPTVSTVEAGSDVTVTITANSGYELDTVTVDGGNPIVYEGVTYDTYTFENVQSDHSLTATFKQTPTPVVGGVRMFVKQHGVWVPLF